MDLGVFGPAVASLSSLSMAATAAFLAASAFFFWAAVVVADFDFDTGFLLFFAGGAGVGFLIVTSASDSELSDPLELELDSVEALRVRPFFFVGLAGDVFFLAAVAAFLAAAAAANLATPEPLDFPGLCLLDDCFRLLDAGRVGFLVVTSSSLSSLLSLKMFLYLPAPASAADVAAFADVEALEAVLGVAFDVSDVVVLVGVAGGFTEGDGCDPGDEEAAIAAFLACCALAASLAIEKAPKGSESESSSEIVAEDFFELFASPAFGLAVADFLGATFVEALASFLPPIAEPAFTGFCLLCFDLFVDSDSEALEADERVVLVVGSALVLGRRDGGFLVFCFFDLSSELSEEELFFELDWKTKSSR